MTKRKFLMSFTPSIVNEPITFRMVKDFDLMLNILRAGVDERGGKLVIEIEGKPSQIKKGVGYLESSGVEVKELNEYVSKDEDRCTSCGACISICPAEAFEMLKDTYKVEFHKDRCIACGLCIDVCSPNAMKLEIW
jgi:NAD-dependent dihydropyrimidine dehydrogenase PreA subunit